MVVDQAINGEYVPWRQGSYEGLEVSWKIDRELKMLLPKQMLHGGFFRWK